MVHFIMVLSKERLCTMFVSKLIIDDAFKNLTFITLTGQQIVLRANFSIANIYIFGNWKAFNVYYRSSIYGCTSKKISGVSIVIRIMKNDHALITP